MAISPAHRFGQIIGDVLEDAIRPLLADFANKHGLYLDQKGPRPCRAGKKCSWVDWNENSHDLDFVLERGGTPEKQGIPAAFIETAWRRYTKHSRNKAQEIQGAVLPLAETYRNAGPFKGAILAGVFTNGALTQLTSLGFTVLYFPYETVVAAFATVGVDASSDEGTPDDEFARKVSAFEALSPAERERLAAELLRLNRADVQHFMNSLEEVVLRQIERIIIIPLHGSAHQVATVPEAISFIENYADTAGAALPVVRYEIEVRYNNGNVIEGKFGDKESAVEFLQTYHPAV
jgi:hypothetical protein